MITEEEARRKWCPHSRPVSVEDSIYVPGTEGSRSFKRGPEGRVVQIDDHCIGSQCMAWRWFDTVSDDGTACHMKPTAQVLRHPNNNPAEAHPLEKRRGFCGLAGAAT